MLNIITSIFRGKRKYNVSSLFWENGHLIQNVCSFDDAWIGSVKGKRDTYTNDRLNKYNQLDISCYSFIEVEPETLCPYSGKQDKNGRPIFHKDVVQIYSEETPYYVLYESGSWVVKSINNLQHLMLYGILSSDIKIIGNLIDGF